MRVLYLILGYFCLPFRFGNSVQLDSPVSDPPLLDSESVPAGFTPEGVDIEAAHQTLKPYSSGSFNGFAGTLGTNRLQH